jgi:hypothetical protein
MLVNDEEPNCLPAIILQGMGQGTLIWNGEKPDMHGIPTAEQRFADYAQRAIKAVFTEFDPGSAVVVDDELGLETNGPIFVIRDHPVGSSRDIDALAKQIRVALQKAIPDGEVRVDVQIRRESPSTVEA